MNASVVAVCLVAAASYTLTRQVSPSAVKSKIAGSSATRIKMSGAPERSIGPDAARLAAVPAGEIEYVETNNRVIGAGIGAAVGLGVGFAAGLAYGIATPVDHDCADDLSGVACGVSDGLENAFRPVVTSAIGALAGGALGALIGVSTGATERFVPTANGVAVRF